MRIAKTGYYLRSLAALVRLVRLSSLAARLLRPAGTLALRDGLHLRMHRRIELLVVKETLVDDAYGRRRLSSSARTIVDVGAGIGDFALAVARALPASRVIAFEPDPVAFSLLAANVEANAAANVEAHHAAVGSAPAYALVDEGPFAGAVPVPPDTPDAVMGVALAAHLGEAEVDLLKVDCEGAELDVLATLGPAGLARVARIALEYHGDGNAQAVGELLERHGFEVTIAPDRYAPGLGYVHAVARDVAPSRLDCRDDRL